MIKLQFLKGFFLNKQQQKIKRKHKSQFIIKKQ